MFAEGWRTAQHGALLAALLLGGCSALAARRHRPALAIGAALLALGVTQSITADLALGHVPPPARLGEWDPQATALHQAEEAAYRPLRWIGAEHVLMSLRAIRDYRYQAWAASDAAITLAIPPLSGLLGAVAAALTLRTPRAPGRRARAPDQPATASAPP